MSNHALLLDAGNTRLKWAVLDLAQVDAHPPHTALSDSPAWLGQGATAYDDLATLGTDWQQWGKLTTCYGVRVANNDSISRVQQLLAPLDLAVNWLQVSERASGVHNGYVPPESLGADRWAALLATRQRTTDCALVISAGTALTIDALDTHGDFLGGLILPGLYSMRQALRLDTAQVGMQYGKLQTFPTNTADAVESGLMRACLGAITTMQAHLENKTGKLPRLFLTGGDGATLRFFLPDGITMVPSLVLEGVYYLSLEAQTT
ncbi:MAG: type III pantothenate kinase [Thiobacillus sp.]